VPICKSLSEIMISDGIQRSQQRFSLCLDLLITCHPPSPRSTLHMVEMRQFDKKFHLGDLADWVQVINASSSTACGFDATWKWPGDPSTVHSYPHVTFSSADLPLPVSNISALRLAASWAYSPGTAATAAGVGRLDVFDATGLDDVGTKANIAFDMFMDSDDKKSQSATAAKYEMMIWIGQVGQPEPIGSKSENATCYTQQLGAYNL
jgi:hypothetical protein